MVSFSQKTKKKKMIVWALKLRNHLKQIFLHRMHTNVISAYLLSKLIRFYFLKEIDFHFILTTSTFFLYCRRKIEINNSSWLSILRKSLGIESRLASKSCWFSRNFQASRGVKKWSSACPCSCCHQSKWLIFNSLHIHVMSNIKYLYLQTMTFLFDLLRCRERRNHLVVNKAAKLNFLIQSDSFAVTQAWLKWVLLKK